MKIKKKNNPYDVNHIYLYDFSNYLSILQITFTYAFLPFAKLQLFNTRNTSHKSTTKYLIANCCLFQGCTLFCWVEGPQGFMRVSEGCTVEVPGSIL